MTDDLERIIRAIRVTQNALRNAALADLVVSRSIADATRSLTDDLALRTIVADQQRIRTVARLATGPLEEMRLDGMFKRMSQFSQEMQRITNSVAVHSAQFRVPDLAVEAGILTDIASGVSETLKRYGQQEESFRRAIQSMHRPWIDMQDELRSIQGMAALQGIGHAVRKMRPFSPDLNRALRIDLGDWRDPITYNSEILEDLGARSDHYMERGFNPALTDFPAPTFKEGLDVTRLDHERPTLVAVYGEPVAASDDNEEEEGFGRTNKAHDWLFRLETHVRRFIDDEMTTAYGFDWPKRQLPSGLYDRWMEKQKKARRGGAQEGRLIAYADFTDYIRIISRRDNWRVFKPVFGRLEDVRESFQRLYPIRLDTMHARPITQDDELLLYVEVRRLVRVMTVEKK